MTLDAPAVLSLIATAGAFVAFLIMLQESIAVGRGQDPISNGVRAVAIAHLSRRRAVPSVDGRVIHNCLPP